MSNEKKFVVNCLFTEDSTKAGAVQKVWCESREEADQLAKNLRHFVGSQQRAMISVCHAKHGLMGEF